VILHSADASDCNGVLDMSVIKINGRFFRLYPPEKFLGHAEKELALNPAETVFLIVDVYGLGFDPEKADEASEWSGMVSEHSKSREKEVIVKHIRPALDAARQVGLPVVYLSNSAPNIALSNSAYQEHKWDVLQVKKDELYAEDNIDPLEYHFGPSDVLKYSQIVAPRSGDYYVRKHVHSGFFDTRLDTLLRNLGCKTLVCAGFALDMCLGNTMIDALWRNYRVLLLRDCTYAIEIPGIDAPGSWTDRWILYTECAIGYTATSEMWIAACSNIDE
jgi:nicotinamidase-related amidase